jgi:hypothetical protein
LLGDSTKYVADNFYKPIKIEIETKEAWLPMQPGFLISKRQLIYNEIVIA